MGDYLSREPFSKLFDNGAVQVAPNLKARMIGPNRYEGAAGDFDGRLLREYDEARVEFNHLKPIEDLRHTGIDFLWGGGVYASVLINRLVYNDGIRVATQTDLEKIIDFWLKKKDYNPAHENLPMYSIIDKYTETALVLSGPRNKIKDYVSKKIFEQVKERIPDVKLPVMIPFASLDLELDEKSYHGLNLNLRDDAEILPTKHNSWSGLHRLQTTYLHEDWNNRALIRENGGRPFRASVNPGVTLGCTSTHLLIFLVKEVPYVHKPTKQEQKKMAAERDPELSPIIAKKVSAG